MTSVQSKRQISSAAHKGNSDLYKLTVQLCKTKLNDNYILREKSDKKAKLVKLCSQHGLDLHVQQPLQTAAEQSVTEDNMIFTLTKTVAELQKSVLSLSGDINKRLQSPNMGDKVASISNQERSTDIQRDSDSVHASIGGPKSINRFLTKFGDSAESLPFIETIHPMLKK